MSAALLAYLAARKRHKQQKKRRDIDAVIDALKDDEDRLDDLAQANALAAQKQLEAEQRDEQEKEERAREGFVGRWVRRIFAVIGAISVQCVQYIIMLYCFQSLASTIRIQEEFYLDKHVGSMVVTNTFDPQHRTLRDVRRRVDVYAWMYNTLVPVLFHNAPEGQSWPDGDGVFSQLGSTPYSTADMVNEANTFALPYGIVFKQVRMEPDTKRACYANHACFQRLPIGHRGDTRSFGYGPNGTGHFMWWSSRDLGADPHGEVSGSHISGHVYSSSGFIAAFRPFFSEVYMPDEEGPLGSITDFRDYEATPLNGRVARYQCARYTTNGEHTVQRCDPGSSGSTGVTRAMAIELLDFLKRGHWIDQQTALVTVSTQVRNNHAGLRFNSRWMFEFTPLAAVLPSYFTETLLGDGAEARLEARAMWLQICLYITCWFMMLEGIELVSALRGSGVFGIAEYLMSAWNLLDWINFMLFFYVYMLLQEERRLSERDAQDLACTSYLCSSFGYFDAWEVFGVARNVKLYLSFCVCIQFLKVIKFTNEIVPKMSLMTRVLTKGASDLILFALIFGISMFAFCMLFYLQLGSAVDDYYSQIYALLSLTRALFGDFNFEEILENSNSYINALLFLVYLFVAVFILLALFLSILGETQSAVRDDERENGFAETEYGFFTYVGQFFSTVGGFAMEMLGGKPPEEEEDDIDAPLSSEAERRLALVQSLRAFKPNFLGMVDEHLGTFENSFVRTVGEIEAQLDERERFERERRGLDKGRSRTGSGLKGGGSFERVRERGGRSRAADGRPRNERRRPARPDGHVRGQTPDTHSSPDSYANHNGRGERGDKGRALKDAPPRERRKEGKHSPSPKPASPEVRGDRLREDSAERGRREDSAERRRRSSSR